MNKYKLNVINNKNWKYNHKINHNINKIWDDIFLLLSKYSHWNFHKMTKSEEKHYIFFNKFKKILESDLNNLNLLNTDSFEVFIDNINNIIKDSIIPKYVDLLYNEEILNNNIQDKEIYLDFILSNIGISESMLIEKTQIDKLSYFWEDSDKSPKFIDIKDLSDSDIDNINDKLQKFIDFQSPLYIKDLKQILWYIKFWNESYSEWVNQYYWLDSIYKYHTNIYSLIYAINIFIEKMISTIILDLSNFIDLLNNDTFTNNKRIIIYLFLKKILTNKTLIKY